MLKITKFNQELLDSFEYDGVDSELSGKDIKEIALFYSRMGESFIGMVDGKIIGVGGFYKLWGSWGSAWLFLNKEAVMYKKSVFKNVVQYLNDFIKNNGIEVMTVECLDQSMSANRLLSHLGFTKNREVKMALYGRKTWHKQ